MSNRTEDITDSISSDECSYNRMDFDIKDGVLVKYTSKDPVVTVPACVIAIGQDAFTPSKINDDEYEDSPVTEVILPEGVKSIGKEAFAYCNNLQKISLPASAVEIGVAAFYGCDSLERIEYSGDMKGWCSIDGLGALLSYGLEGTELFIDGEQVTGDIALPDGVEKIKDSAFKFCDSITSVTVPNSVTYIGSHAFSYCRSLKNITVPSSVKEIMPGAFFECSSLESITLPFLGPRADDKFETNKFGLNFGPIFTDGNQFVPESLKKVIITDESFIADNAFENCKNIESVALPDSVESVGEDVFVGCDGLRELILPAKALSVCASAPALRKIVVTSGKISKKYFSDIADIAEDIEELFLTDGVTSIEEGALYPFTSLKTLALPYLGTSKKTSKTLKTMFGGSVPHSLETVTVKSGVICYEAFKNCSSLRTINLLNGVKTIWNSAFDGCSALGAVLIHSSVEEIGSYVFDGCDSVVIYCEDYSPLSCWSDDWNCGRPVIWGFSAKSYNNISGWTLSGTVLENCAVGAADSVRIPDGITVIGNNAFSGCGGLKSITIPDSVTSIEEAAFEECDALERIEYSGDMEDWCSIDGLENLMYYGSESLSLFIDGEEITGDLVIPDGVTEIGKGAFCGCSSLTSVTISYGVTSIGDNAFSDCTSLTSVSIPGSVGSIGGDAFDGCDSLERIEYSGDMEDWCSIYGLENLMYYGSESLSLFIDGEEITGDLVIPDGVTSIGERAFSGCSGLTSVTIPDGVTSIGERAFSGCSGLTSVTIPDSVKSIGDYAFCGCTGLTSLTIGNGVTSIGDYAFSDCTSLASVSIPDGVKNIGRGAFYGCTSLTSVTIPDGVERIGDYAFSDCTSLASVSIPDGVKNIGGGAFYGCTSLTSVTIPDGVTEIGGAAFYGCDSLESITLPFVGDKKEPQKGDKAYPFGYIFGEHEDVERLGYDFGENEDDEQSGVLQTYVDANGQSLIETAYFIPPSVKYVTVTGGKIIDYAFANCKGLITVTLADGVTSICGCAFKNCTSLTSVSISDGVKSIGDCAFCGCTGLTSITIGNGVTSIGEEAFCGCTSLASVSIPKSVTSIGSKAFSGCRSLKTIVIPDGVKVIACNAFDGCGALNKVTVGKRFKRSLEDLFGKDCKKRIVFTFT